MEHEYDIELFRRWVSRDRRGKPYSPEEFDKGIENALKEGIPSRCTRTDVTLSAALRMAYDYDPVAAFADPPYANQKRLPSAKQVMEWYRAIATGEAGREHLEEFADVKCSECVHAMPCYFCCPNHQPMTEDAHGLWTDPYKCHFERRES